MNDEQDIQFQALDPDKVWVITAPSIQAAEDIRHSLEEWQAKGSISINGIIVTGDMDFKEVEDDWLEAYIRSLQDILLERKTKHETTNTDAP